MNHASNEAKQFHAATLRAVRLVRQVAVYAGDDYKPLEQKALRAVDRCYYICRFQVDAGAATAQCEGIHAAWRFATRWAMEARSDRRCAELAKIKEAIRIQNVERRLAVGY